MDFIQTYAPYLSSYLPPSLFTALIQFLTSTFAVLKTLQTHLTPLLHKITTQPDIASILALLVLLLISLKVLDMAYRAVMFWIRLVFSIALWGGMAIVGLWVYNRGPDGFVEDVGELARFWWVEFGRLRGEADAWRREGERKVMYGTQKKSGWGYGYWGQNRW
ncbi:hypothetical protein CC80DRAFT_445659 [Byssothecium circinans]|uniref:Nuclear pore assembly and biogenesis-domain-containing protein n=1 Tax=Byssothecium circinans TaxID=147558 RepID=A0A6A5TUU1_9PLEO|nr:hypothetical protein CC80DRAFT_445659 [Byssothecium circinans]